MRDIQTIAGTWRLIGAGASSALPTPHHVKFVFSVEGGRVRGTIVRQDDDGQFPVEVVLDGPQRQLRIISPVPIPGGPANDVGTAWTCRANGTRSFELRPVTATGTSACS